MLCAISGESPSNPVASKKSGTVFEKDLIEAYISENRKDPVTNEELSIEDLVELKSAPIARPRPPKFTSIPSLLSTFQNEWDALTLETFTLRQHLTQTRQELSTALYQHDAAVRVIARLTKERDEAREALSKIEGHVSNGDAMQVDGTELPKDLVAKVTSTQEKLSSTRRKRTVPEDWVTSDDLHSFTPLAESTKPRPGARSISVNTDGDLTLVGGTDGYVDVYSANRNEVLETLNVGGGAITDCMWLGGRIAVGTSSGGVKVFDNGSETLNSLSHSGEVNGLALHPSGELLASVGADQSFVLYDLATSKQAMKLFTDCALTTVEFHPDGHLLAAGGADGQIKIFEVKTGTNAANFDMSDPIETISFSENGIWVAAVTKHSTSIAIWDIRKSAPIKVIETGGQISQIKWDYTGQFLALAGPSGVAVQKYTKATKEWSEPLKTGLPAVAVGWGFDAKKLVVLTQEGGIKVLGQG